MGKAAAPFVVVALVGMAVLLGGCQNSCSQLKTPEEQKACEDQAFQRFQQQLRDSRPAGR